MEGGENQRILFSESPEQARLLCLWFDDPHLPHFGWGRTKIDEESCGRMYPFSKNPAIQGGVDKALVTQDIRGRFVIGSLPLSPSCKE